MKNILYTLTLCVIILFVCNQCNDPSDVTFDKLIEQEVLDFYDYKNGTYWVYQDTFGNIDSTWVSDYKVYQSQSGRKGGTTVQKIVYYINSNRTTDRIKADIAPAFTENITGCQWTMVNAQGTSQGWGWTLTYGNNTFYSSKNIVEHYDSYTVNGEVFTDVYEMRTSNSPYASILTIAKNKGIIRKKIDFDLNDFKLIRYNIVR